jgi:hypothetical protein
MRTVNVTAFLSASILGSLITLKKGPIFGKNTILVVLLNQYSARKCHPIGRPVQAWFQIFWVEDEKLFCFCTLYY